MANESAGVTVSGEEKKDGKDKLRRNSTGKKVSSTKGDNLEPHYLRASTGSCHDACKYGKEHTFQTKPWRPLRKKPPAKLDDQHPVEIVVLVNKKKVKSNELELSPTMQSPVPVGSPSHESSESAKIGTSSPMNEISVETSKSVSHEVLSNGEYSHSDVLESSQQEDSSFVGSASPDIFETVNENAVLHEQSSMIDDLGTVDGGSMLSTEQPSVDAEKSMKEEVPATMNSANEHIVQNGQSSMVCSSETVGVESALSIKQPSLDAVKPVKDEVPASKKSVLAGASKSKKVPSTKNSLLAGASKPIKRGVPSPVNQKINPRNLSSNSNEKSISGKPSASPKPRRTSTRSVASSNPSEVSTGKTNSGTENLHKPTTLKVTVKKVLALPAASLSPTIKRTSKVASERTLTASTASLSSKTSARRAASLGERANMNQTMVDQKTEAAHKRRSWFRKSEADKVGKEEVPEKTLHVIKAKPDRRSPGSSQNGNRIKKSPSPISHPSLKTSPKLFSRASSRELDGQYESGYTDTEGDEHISDRRDLKEKNKMRPRSSRKPYPKEENSSAVKLSFRKGKVVEPETETTTPRRLRFRRARVWDHRGLNGDPRRISFRRRLSDVSIGSSRAAEKVVLRHQDVQGKKNEQVLFNNVIEETASKLVETRKSKVKALVGAFETVISIQEGKRPVAQRSIGSVS